LTLVGALTAIGALPGCNTTADISGMRPQNISDKTPGSDPRITALQARYSPEVINACEARSGDPRTACRNDIVLAELTASDVAFENFEWAAWGTDAGVSTLADFSVLGLTAAGALSPTGAAQVLSATAAAVTGAKTSVEKNFLYAKTVDQLIFSMSITRGQIRNHIITCLSLPASQYDINMGVYDALQYQAAGVLPSAIANLTSTATGNSSLNTCGSAPVPTVQPPPAVLGTPVTHAPAPPPAPQ
jgi:hypothetical protein